MFFEWFHQFWKLFRPKTRFFTICKYEISPENDLSSDHQFDCLYSTDFINQFLTDGRELLKSSTDFCLQTTWKLTSLQSSFTFNFLFQSRFINDITAADYWYQAVINRGRHEESSSRVNKFNKWWLNILMTSNEVVQCEMLNLFCVFFLLIRLNLIQVNGNKKSQWYNRILEWAAEYPIRISHRKAVSVSIDTIR